ncbi:MAG TPA: hypothetical protein VMQ45_02985 [Burkholderiaceae bacterium]|nr:hypothetical protein [Burkholderiaceae bacterium]
MTPEAIRGVAASVLAAAFVSAQAVDIEWDGICYLRVPVKLGSDTRLVMPEPFDDAWEHDDEISTTLLDARTLIVRPRTAKIEQRLTLRGRSSGLLYLARVSTALPYTPVVIVHSSNLKNGAPGESSDGLSITALLRAMMLGTIPPGFRVERSTRVLLDQPPYRVVAEHLWQSFRQAGVIARVTSAFPQRTVPIVPANIQIQIPQLGSLRAMAADEYELGPEQLSSRVYIVYGR